MDLIAIKNEIKEIEEKVFTLSDPEQIKALANRRHELVDQLNSTTVKGECLKYLSSVKALEANAQRREKNKIVDSQKQLLELPLTQSEFYSMFDGITIFPETLYLLFKNQSIWLVK